MYLSFKLLLLFWADTKRKSNSQGQQEDHKSSLTQSWHTEYIFIECQNILVSSDKMINNKMDIEKHLLW